MNNYYHIRPIFEERIWGGQLIKEKFHYETDLSNIAEAYHVIAIPNHLDNIVEEENIPLSKFYKEHRNLFGCETDELPVRLVTACANGSLSCHLHPSDEYGLAHEGMRGKVEGGFALSEDDVEVDYCIGHNAKSKEEFIDLVNRGEWDKLLRHVKGKLTDYSHTPIGTLHMESGDGSTIVVAYSNNGDVTYRLYDSGRNDPKRPLNIPAVLDNVNIPDDQIAPYHVEPYEKDGCLIYDYYAKAKEYVGKRVKCDKDSVFTYNNFMFVLCLDGETNINDCHISPGETIFIPQGNNELHFDNKADLCVLSYID